MIFYNDFKNLIPNVKKGKIAIIAMTIIPIMKDFNYHDSHKESNSHKKRNDHKLYEGHKLYNG